MSFFHNSLLTVSRFISALGQSCRAPFLNFKRRLPFFLQLMRLHRPVGIYLLLWPTLTALFIAAQGWPEPNLLFIFIAGTVLMRSAGCCINDYADYDLDGRVLRTRDRPLVKNQVKRGEALLLFAGLCITAFILVLFTNTLTLYLSVAGAIIVVIYPFMKRYTHLAQLVLGAAFSWGILLAFTAQLNALPIHVSLLFIANYLWIIAYDTQYAMVDREYDIQIGIKSTAILFADADKIVIGFLQLLFIITLILSAARFDLGFWFYLGLSGASVLLLYQQFLIRHREPSACFAAFLNNNWVGAVIFMGTFLHYLIG